MSKKSEFRSAVAQSFLIVVSVLLALAAENWREGFNERNLEEDFLRSMAEGLQRDTAEISFFVDGASRQQEHARLVLDVILSARAPADPERFLMGVEASARFGVPTISDDAYQDLTASGQLGIIRNVELRRQAALYYSGGRADSAVDLWRSRIWYQFGPIAIDVLPLEVQEWAAATVGRGSPDSPTEPVPRPPNVAQIAADVANQLRAIPQAEGLIKAVVRSGANQARSLIALRELAVDLLLTVEAELAAR